jgi:hypothetical protein
MERLGILDPSNEVHLWCLHLVLLPIINKHIVCWQNGWIHHPIRTERNKTPMQLWIQGLNAISATGSTIANEVFQVRITFKLNYCSIISSSQVLPIGSNKSRREFHQQVT